MSRFAVYSVIASVVAFTAGCAIPYSDGPGTETLNHCASDDECAAGGTCRDERCTGTEIDLTGLILVARPNSGASFGASTSFLVSPGDTIPLHTTDPNGYSARVNIQLPSPIPITEGKIHLEYASNCPLAADSSFPATIRFDRVTELSGFHFDPFTATAVKSDTSAVYGFDASVLPGIYDVYIQPLPIPGCEADTPPPVFYPKQEITSESEGLSWGVIKPVLLGGDIQIPDGGDLTGFRLDIVEPEGGRVISTTQILEQPPGALVVPIKLAFSWADTASSPYLRLRPEEGTAMPSVYWGLFESLKSLTDPVVHLSVANLQIAARAVGIQVQNADFKGVAALVKVQSVELSGEVANNATFSVEDETDPNGFFETDLPPGTYLIRVTPRFDDTLAISEREITVPALDPNGGDDQDVCICGLVVTADRRTELSGTVFTPDQQPLADALINTAPSQLAPLSYWSRVHALDTSLPRATSTTTTDQGLFRLGVDLGESDLSVHPPSSAGYPWLVDPRYSVQLADDAVPLGDLVLPNPVVIHGTIFDPSGAVATNVVVDAWLPVRDSSAPNDLTGTVIQIGTTASDENGNYTLLLPPSLTLR